MTLKNSHRFLLVALATMLLALTGAATASTPEVGDKFPGFEGKTQDGTPISLADYSDKKAVLVDFWATWCGPCIVEMPNVRAAYAKYHEMGFDIIAISLDSNNGKLQAYYEDPSTTLPWPSVFDGKGWQAELAQKYDINAIPATFLLDGNGVVVATGARGLELHREIAKLVDPDNIPLDLKTALKAYKEAEGADRKAAKKQLIETAGMSQGEVNYLAWTDLDTNENMDKAAARLWFELMMPTVKEADNVGAMDTAALAAYVMGDAAEAARIQMSALNMYREHYGDEFAGMVTEDAGVAELSIREALYQLASGDGMAAKKTYDSLKPVVEDLNLADTRYWKWLDAKMTKSASKG